MAIHNYTIASDEGAQRFGAEVGDRKELDLSVDEQRALVAAGWIEEIEDKKEVKK